MKNKDLYKQALAEAKKRDAAKKKDPINHFLKEMVGGFKLLADLAKEEG